MAISIGRKLFVKVNKIFSCIGDKPGFSFIKVDLRFLKILTGIKHNFWKFLVWDIAIKIEL